MHLIEDSNFGIFGSKVSGKDDPRSKSRLALDEPRHGNVTWRKRLTFDSMGQVHKKLKSRKLNVVHPVIQENLLFASKYSQPDPRRPRGLRSQSSGSPGSLSQSSLGKEDNPQTTDRPLVASDEMLSSDPHKFPEQNSKNTLGRHAKKIDSKRSSIGSRKSISEMNSTESRKSN